MLDSKQVHQDTIAVVGAILQMGFASNEEEVDILRKVRESVYSAEAGYTDEDLRRMIRNVSRMFSMIFVSMCKANHQDPLKSWQESCMSMAIAMESLGNNGDDFTDG